MGFSAGYLINKCNVSGLFNQAQIDKLKEDLELLPEQIVDYLDNIYSNFNLGQLYQLIYGLRDGLNSEQIAVYANNSFSVTDMAMARFSMTNGIALEDTYKFIDDLGAGLNESQKGEIKRGIEDGYGMEQIKLYTKPQFKNYYDMRKMREQALRLTNEQARFINNLNYIFDFSQMQEIIQGYENGLTNEQIAVFADAQFSANPNNNQMREIRLGLEMGILPDLVKTYAVVAMTPKAMENARNKILSNPEEAMAELQKNTPVVLPQPEPMQAQTPQIQMPNLAEISVDQPLDILSANYEDDKKIEQNDFVDLDDFLPQEPVEEIKTEQIVDDQPEKQEENKEDLQTQEPIMEQNSQPTQSQNIDQIADNLIDEIDPNLSLEEQIGDYMTETQSEKKEPESLNIEVSLDEEKNEPKIEISSNIDDMLSQISDSDLPTNDVEVKDKNVLENVDVSGLVKIDEQTEKEDKDIDDMIEKVNLIDENLQKRQPQVIEQDLEAKESEIDEKVNLMGDKIINFDTKISDIKNAVDSEISKLGDKITKTDSNLELINSKMSNLDEQILVANSKFANVDEGILDSKQKIEAFDAKMGEFSSNLSNLQNLHNTNFANIKKEQEVINSVIQKVKSSDVVIKTISDNLSDLSSKFVNLDANVKNLEKQDNSKADFAQISLKVDSLSNKINGLSDIMKNLVDIQKQQSEFLSTMKKELDDILKQNSKNRPNFRRF